MVLHMEKSSILRRLWLRLGLGLTASKNAFKLGIEDSFI